MAEGAQELNDQVRTAARYRAILESEPWQFLLTRAAEQVDGAVDALKETDPYNAKEIAALQGVIRRNEDIGRWLREVLDAGDLARELIEAEGVIEQGQ